MHTRLLLLLEEKLTHWSPQQTVGDALSHELDWIESMYATYCLGASRPAAATSATAAYACGAGLDAALAFLSRCTMASSALRIFLAACYGDPRCQGDSLRCMLRLPSQRLRRMLELVTHLQACTDGGHRDQLLLAHVAAGLRSSIEHVCARLQKQACARQWTALRKQLVPAPLLSRLDALVPTAALRQVVRQCTARRRSRSASGELRPCHVFLLGGALLVCEGNFFSGFYVLQLVRVGPGTKLEPFDGADYALLVSDADAEQLVVAFDSAMQCREWSELVNELCSHVRRPPPPPPYCVCIPQPLMCHQSARDCLRAVMTRCIDCNNAFSTSLRRFVCEFWYDAVNVHAARRCWLLIDGGLQLFVCLLPVRASALGEVRRQRRRHSAAAMLVVQCFVRHDSEGAGRQSAQAPQDAQRVIWRHRL